MHDAPLPVWSMANLFDSEQYTVVMSPSTQHGAVYEIVEKSCAQEVILTGIAALAFEAQRQRWNEVTPAEEDVHEVLAGYMSLGRFPLCIH